MWSLDPNTTETFVLNQISAKRFAHVFSTYELPIRIIYKSSSLPTINQARAFRLNLYKISQDYFHHDDFHYISYQKNQTVMIQTHHSVINFIPSRVRNGLSMVNTKILPFPQDYILQMRISLFKLRLMSISIHKTR